MPKRGIRKTGCEGFSLVELMVALGVTLVIMVVAGRMLAMSMSVRTRENARIEAISDVQRALQVMTREIGNAGLGLSTNGIHPTDSNASQIRVRSNINAFGIPPNVAPDTDTLDSWPEGSEDIVFAIINNYTGTEPTGQRLITRQDLNVPVNKISQLANRVDSLQFEYLKADGTAAASPAQAGRVRITVGVDLPPVGRGGDPGYQPASRVLLTSDVTLRNSLLDK